MYCEDCGKEIKEPNEQGDFICEDCEIYCDKCGDYCVGECEEGMCHDCYDDYLADCEEQEEDD